MRGKTKVISTTEQAKKTREAFITKLNADNGLVTKCPSCQVKKPDVSNGNNEKQKE